MSLQGDMGSFGGPSGDKDGGNGDNSPGRNQAQYGTPTGPPSKYYTGFRWARNNKY